MEELKYCRVCLATDVKMHSLDITSNDSIGLIYFHLSQIRICDRNQHVCYECAGLLFKYQKFKSKCLRAHSLLSKITVNSVKTTKDVIKNIDRKSNQLESNLIYSETGVWCTPSNKLNDEDCSSYSILFKEDIITENTEFDIKTEKDIAETFNSNKFLANYSETVTNISNTTSTNTLIKISKTKEHKTKRRKMKTEIQSKIDDIVNIDESHDDFIDNDFQETAEEITPIEVKRKPRTRIIKEHKTKKRKIKTVTNTDDDFSDNEPLSKCAIKTSNIEVTAPVYKKRYHNFDFFEDYATVTFLTPDDARKELLSRKESSNYKRCPFKCDLCYKGYEAKTAFENHMKKHSVEYGDYECDLCHLRFRKQSHVCKHKLSCHKRKFSCKLCTYVCYCLEQARTHVSLHQGKKYPCKICGEVFSMPNSLLMHKRMKHLDESVCEYVCEICGSCFGSSKGLFLHNMKVHRMDKNSKQGPKCEECNIHFSTEVAWKRHLVLSFKHVVNNGCKYCGERFTNADELKTHTRTNHPRAKVKADIGKVPAACLICNKWLISHAEYNNHVKTEHPDSKEAQKVFDKELAPFVCEICGKTFKQQCFLTYHQRTHSGARPHACATCPRTFRSRGALHSHGAAHAPAPAPRCHLCARTFTFKSALNKHMKLHLGIRPHKCTICDKAFLHLCDLKLHIKYVHDKVPWPKRKSKQSMPDDNTTYSEPI